MFQTFNFTYEEARPSHKEFMEYLQTPDDNAYSIVEATVNKTLEQLKNVQGIIGGYNILPCKLVDVPNGEVLCSVGTLHTGKRISSYMKDATQLVLFLCTAGPFFTKMKIKYQKEGNYLESFVVDAMGTAFVEKAMAIIQIDIAKKCHQKGDHISNRYSPGYCEWPTLDQKYLFSYIGEQPTGILLSETCLMSPIKSISGIIGIGKDLRKKPYGCATCNSKLCIYKRMKEKIKLTN